MLADREKVIRGLEVCKTSPEFREECAGCPYDDGEEDCIARMAADALELLKAQETGWISVKDRLPEEPGQYLCWFGANKLAIGPAIASYVDKWKAFGLLETLEKYPNITHWMPLPEPPKGET